MGRKSSDDKDAEVVRSIKKLVDNSDSQVAAIKTQWRANFDMFVNGSRFEDKEEWQTQFSVNKLETSTRAAQSRLVNILVNTPDWFELAPRSPLNKQADALAPAFEKIVNYYLSASKFKRHAGTFFLCSLISQGNLYVGWKPRLIQNPEYVLEKTQKEIQAIQRGLAQHVVNPQVDSNLQGDDLEQSLIDAVDGFMSEAQGLPIEKPKIPPYVQIGGLDLIDINHENSFWDPSCQYMEDSPWRAFRMEIPRYELNRQAKLGFYSKAKVKNVGDRKDPDVRQASLDVRYRKTQTAISSKGDMVNLLFYFGPYIDPDSQEVLKENYYCVIANDSVVLKEGEYPFWEPPSHRTALVTAAVRQIPFRPTGAGIGDSAVILQKTYDSNLQLICDSFRNNISGLNVINQQKLVDKGQLDEGIYPGMTLHVRDNPKDVFEHINLTSNIENQASPIQSILSQAIDSATGINELMTGGGNEHSRTSAKETGARLDAGNDNVNIIALDLEQNFLVPALQKVFARVLQFGLGEVQSNPELAALLTDDEIQQITQINAGNRMTILNQWYNFVVKGFSSATDKNEAAMRDNELLQIINSGGPLAQLINLPAFMKQYFKNREIKNPEELLLSDSPLIQVTAENQVLMAGHDVMPGQADDHEFHISQHQPLADSPYGTPQMQQHNQIHMQMLQQMQAAQQQGPQQGPPQPPRG